MLKEDENYGISNLMLCQRSGLGNTPGAAEIEKFFRWVSPVVANTETKESVLLGGKHYGTNLRYSRMEERCSSHRN